MSHDVAARTQCHETLAEARTYRVHAVEAGDLDLGGSHLSEGFLLSVTAPDLLDERRQVVKLVLARCFQAEQLSISNA